MQSELQADLQPRVSRLARIPLAFLAGAGLLLSSPLFCQSSVNLKGGQPQRFYIVRELVSDAAPHWFDYIMDVRPEGTNVLVRYIRIAPENAYCADLVTVKATEARLPDTAVSGLVAGFGLCDIPEHDVERSIANAKPVRIGSVMDSEKYGVVVWCGNQVEMFRLPFPEEVDMPALRAAAPKVAKLYDLAEDVYKHAFGEKEVFHDLTPEQDQELERFGASFVAALRSGTYDLGFSDEKTRRLCSAVSPRDLGLTRQLLAGYEGPGHKPHDPKATIVDRGKYRLSNFLAPEYPRLAMLARIQGEVEVRTWVDVATGTVNRVRAVSGHPLLQKAAEKSISQWRFQPGATTGSQPISVLVDFVFDCTNSSSQ